MLLLPLCMPSAYPHAGCLAKPLYGVTLGGHTLDAHKWLCYFHPAERSICLASLADCW